MVDSPVTVNSNWRVQCNASYGGGQIYVYSTSAVCANTGEISGIAVHEFGHGLDDNDGGGWDNTSEAYADIAAIYRLHASCVGHGFWHTQDKGCGMTSDGTGFNGRLDGFGGDQHGAAQQRHDAKVPGFEQRCPFGVGQKVDE